MVSQNAQLLLHLVLSTFTKMLGADVPFFCSGPESKTHLFITSTQYIHAINLVTGKSAVLITGLWNTPTMAIDIVEKKLYYESGNGISKAKFDGTDVEVILTNVNARHMTIDWLGRRIIWTDEQRRYIFVANLDGKQSRALTTTINIPYDIEVDPNVG